RLDLVPGARYAFNQDWAVVGGGLFEFAGERDVDVEDAVTYGGYVGVRHKFSDNFAATLGLVAKTRLEDTAIFLPLVGVDWNITDKLTLSSSATSVKVTDKLDDHWSFWVSGAWELREYRLEDDGPLPSGVVRDKRIPIKAGIDWSPCPHATISLEAGAVV